MEYLEEWNFLVSIKFIAILIFFFVIMVLLSKLGEQTLMMVILDFKIPIFYVVFILACYILLYFVKLYKIECGIAVLYFLISVINLLVGLIFIFVDLFLFYTSFDSNLIFSPLNIIIILDLIITTGCVYVSINTLYQILKKQFPK